MINPIGPVGGEGAQPGTLGRARFSNPLKALVAQVRRYGIVARWLFRDAWLGLARNYALIAVLSGFQVLSQLGAIGIIALFLHAAESQSVIEVAGYAIQPISLTGLYTATTLVGSFIIFAALARYAAVLQELDIARRYERRCIVRVCERAAGMPDGGITRRIFNRLVSGDTRYCGRVARISSKMILPLFSMTAMTAALVYLDALTTLLIVILLLASMPLFYLINVMGATASLTYEKLAAATSQERKRLLQAAQAGASRDEIAELARQATEAGPWRQQLEAYIRRLKVGDLSAFLSTLLAAIALAVILFRLGREPVTEGTGFWLLAAYVLILRFMLSNVTQVATVLTVVNRFYPFVARYRSFVEGEAVLFSEHLLEVLASPADEELD